VPEQENVTEFPNLKRTTCQIICLTGCRYQQCCFTKLLYLWSTFEIWSIFGSLPTNIQHWA